MSDSVPVPQFVPVAPADREQFWRDAVAAFTTSGLSVREFCRQRGLPERRFHAWRKNLGLSPVARPAATRPMPGFIPVRLVSDATAEVSRPNGMTVRLPVSSDPTHVARPVATGGIFLAVDPQDGRKGIDGLAGVVVAALGRDPTSGDRFVFLNKKGDRLKILAWEGDGFALYLRRLERGTFAFPPASGVELAVTPAHARSRARYTRPANPA